MPKRKKLSSFQSIILGFAGVILIGALLLMLPFAAKSGRVTPFNETLFTSTSAVCVTGLVVRDTGSYWSAFGQGVILVLIQIGGLGVITVGAALALVAGRKISLMQRNTMQEAVSAPKIGGIVRLTGFILKGTFAVELLGALLLMPVFCRDFGIKGVWMAVFHSISAFCNAGFDVVGTTAAPFASLTAYRADPLINCTLMLLIIFGGLGFLTWDDFREHKFRFRRYRMQSKVILVTSGILIFVPALYLFFWEYQSLPLGERVLTSLFQAVTPRTAGFNTADLSKLSGVGQLLFLPLMLIGGSPGSTAGGMKTTTAAVLLLNVFAVFRRREDAQCFGRRIDGAAVRQAATILVFYLTLFFGGAVIISLMEGLPINVCLFEAASAVGTVGLSLGLTPSLGFVSHMVLILLMFLGRVGGLTFIYAAISGSRNTLSKLPQEKITVG
ncbi:MAG: Trk family potassium uptake protein [Acutalibacter sp.]|nr:Trk family potassium uptake protein [Acutalibacter sp.]